jgi:RNA 3'-terminal phosphate cyclase (ATP)
MRVEEIQDAAGPGNALLIEVHGEKQTEVFTGFGQKGLPAETVAKRAAAQVQAYLEAEVPIGPQLADQLVLPLALAGGGRFVTGKPTLHTTTNLEVIRRFLEIDATIREEPSGRFEIQIGSRQPTNE